MRRIAGVAATLILVCATFVIGAAPAAAVGGTLNLSMEAVSSNVPSGQGAAFRVQWTCSGSGAGGEAASCDDATISIPVPTALTDSAAFPDGVPLPVTSQSQLQVGGVEIPDAAEIIGTAPNQTLRWTFPETIATGSSGTVSFTLTPPNSVTPNGATITPEATFAATDADSVTATATTTVDSQISLTVSKHKASPTSVPYVDQQVTYGILVGYDAQMPTDGQQTYVRNMNSVCQDLGTQALENLVVIDELPAGAQFVSANFDGTYDAANNSVTWNLGSSISDTAPYTCLPFSGATGWTGAALNVTVIYPSDIFDAAPDPAVENTVEATANPWGQPDVGLSSDDATTHGLREGSAGAAVGKQPGYDWAIASPLFRTQDGNVNSLYQLTGTSTEAETGQWSIIDVMPCALTSPMDEDATDCSTPAYTELRFAADRFLPELDVHWTTNAGSTGVCTIAAGSSMSDTTRRFCSGSSATTAVPVPSGEWITKIEIDTEVPPFGGGTIHIYGRVSEDVPTSNVDTDYNNPNLDVDRSDVHPWYVTVENCTVENTITFPDGRQYLPDDTQTAADNGGICGYRQVSTDPFQLRPVKQMYDPAIPVGQRPTTPSVQTGELLTVDLQIQRDRWAAAAAIVDQATLTPTVTEFLPPSLTFIDDTLEIVGDATFRAALGAPHVEVTTVDFDGEQREQIEVTFPDAEITPSATVGRSVQVRFTVRVNEGTPAGQYTNDYFLEGVEGGAGVDDTYLGCPTGTMVDAEMQPTTDRAVAAGCLASATYNVLPVPGVSTSKTVLGSYDSESIAAPGIGSTDLNGDAQYTIHVVNSGSVDIQDVVTYDILPRIGDTAILPGSTNPRNSDFPVVLTGAVDAPGDATVEYSTSTNPCRGDLAGTGGGTVDSAPTDCTNDWSATPPDGDFAAVTALRIDFADRIFAASDMEEIVLDVRAEGPNVTADAELDGIAWNNTAIFGREASSGSAILPTEASSVGLQLLPDIAWEKRDGNTEELLDGSEWSLTPVLDPGEELPDGWPMTIVDCTAEPCIGPDTDPTAGLFQLVGVPWGEYLLEETTAPSGYQPITDPIEVSLTPENVERDTFVLELGEILNYPPVGAWTMSKSSDPAPGTTVAPGDTLTYTLTAVNDSAIPVADVVVTDDLSEVLDAAAFGEFTEDDGGLATFSGETITWNVGALEANESRDVSYTVTVNEDSVGVALRNFATGVGEVPPDDCTPESPCGTEHPTPGDWTASKVSDPAAGTVVVAGQTVTYTLTAWNDSPYLATGVVLVDDLSGVLDDANFDAILEDDEGRATLSGDTITWEVGELAPDESRTVVYSVTVLADGERGDNRLGNVLTPLDAVDDPDCEDENVWCTEHPVPQLASWKSVEADSSPVAAGTVLTYTLTFDSVGEGPVSVDEVDDLTHVLDDGDVTAGPTVSDPALTVTGLDDNNRFHITGLLDAGEVVTVTYEVTLRPDGERGDNRALNFLLDPDEDPLCDPAEEDCEPPVCEDGDERCTETPTGELVDFKSVDPGSNTPVTAGSELTYTLTFINVGAADVEVDRVDDLTHVLDDADLIDGPTVSDDALSVSGPDDSDRISITGILEPGETVTVAYTVRVREAAERGDDLLANFLFDPEDETPEDPEQCEPAPDEFGDCTTNPIGNIVSSKSVDPESGSTVVAGEELTYTVAFENVGRGVDTVDYIDYIAGVLDDAELISGPTSSDDAVTASGPDDEGRISITGIVDAGETVTITYTVRVKPDGERGDNVLSNFVVEDGVEPPTECLETNPLCTVNPVPELVDWKSVDPASNTPVTAGSELTYTLTFTNEGKAAGDVDRVDDLTHVLDDAELIDGPTVSDDALSVSGPDDSDRISITGILEPGETVTVAYTVRVREAAERGDDLLANFLFDPEDETPEDPEQCEPAPDEFGDCTRNPVGNVTAEKSVDPESGTEVAPGDELTYTLTFTNHGQGADEVDYVDHAGGIADDTTLIDGPSVSDESLAVDGPDEENRFHITGTLDAGETATVTYTVRVNPYDEQGDGVLMNFLVPDGQEPPSGCVATNPLCTENPIEDPPGEDPPGEDPPGEDPPGKVPPKQPRLPDTGSGLAGWIPLAGLVLLFAGLSVAASTRRRVASGVGDDGEGGGNAVG